ncbi:MAG: radical SAM protein [Synechococcaceae cyanobacterium SM1_2_3]|nr:radical SAM protein [Synechococcaceae cyanobacterium SM1_2_3]
MSKLISFLKQKIPTNFPGKWGGEFFLNKILQDFPTQESSRIPLPSEFLIDTGNLCNLRCPFCPTGINRPGMSQGLMSLDAFKTVLAKISPYAYYLEMMNWGEPFLNPDLLEMIDLAAAKGIRINIDSNLSFREFNEAEAERIVRSGLWKISGSIDGGNEETYLQYRRRGNFNRALNNLALLQRTRARLGSATPIIVWQFLINGKNHHQIETAKAMAADMGISIIFRLMSTWGEAEWHSPFHDLAERGEFNEEEWSFPAPNLGKDLFFTPKPSSGKEVKFTPSLPAGVPDGCAQPFNRMVINWNGKVLPCCLCYGDHFYVGDLLTQSIEEIWWGDALRKSRQFLSNYGPKQETHSVCETGACALNVKYLGEPDPEKVRRHDLTFAKLRRD